MLILGMVMAVVGLVLVLVIAAALVLAVIELLVRLVLTTALAILAGAVVGIVVALAGGDGTLAGSVTTVIAILPTLLLVNRWRSTLATPLPSTEAAPIVEPSLMPLDEHERAWAIGRKFAPQGALDNAYAASQKLLQLVDRQDSIDPELIEHAVILRRHVPGLVDDTETVLANATTDERRIIAMAELVKDLQMLGAAADALLKQRVASAQEQLKLRRARLFGEGSTI